MLQPSILKFLSALKKNNNREWFEIHRKEYEEAKSGFSSFVTGLISSISAFDAPIAALQAKDCMFRINRDIRFSKDKRPYKNNMAAYFNKAGKKGSGAGYYVHIEPGNSFVAAGLWMPPAEDLLKIRQEIDYHFPEWKKLVSAASFKKYFPEGIRSDEMLSRPPKGYQEENPAITYLKMKSYVASRAFSDKEVLDKLFVKEVSKSLEKAKPVIDFINRSLD
jgi:uncharacterized protein (TIGR02453 family)